MFRFGTCMTSSQVRTEREEGWILTLKWEYLIEDNYETIPQVYVSSLQWDITKPNKLYHKTHELLKRRNFATRF